MCSAGFFSPLHSYPWRHRQACAHIFIAAHQLKFELLWFCQHATNTFFLYFFACSPITKISPSNDSIECMSVKPAQLSSRPYLYLVLPLCCQCHRHINRKKYNLVLKTGSLTRTDSTRHTFNTKFTRQPLCSHCNSFNVALSLSEKKKSILTCKIKYPNNKK